MSVVPAMLAERLGLPQVTLVSEVIVDGSTVTGRRDGDTATEMISASLPLVGTVVTDEGDGGVKLAEFLAEKKFV